MSLVFFTNEILRYDGTSGKFIDAFVSSGSGGLDLPTGLTFGPDGNLYVASGNTNEILRYDGTSGKFIDAFVSSGRGGLDGPKDLMFSSDNRYLFVTSFFTNEILRYDGTSGKFIDVFASSYIGGLSYPQHLIFGPDGNLYVASGNTNEILRYDGTSGKFIDAFVSSGSGGLDLPTGLTFGPDGNLYVASGNTNEILRYDGTSGKFIDAFVSSGSGGLDLPTGLTFGPDGNLYVASGNTNEILRYDGTSGKFIDVFIFKNSGGLDFPTKLIIDSNFDIYVVSRNNDQILKYSQNGMFQDIFVSGPELFSPLDLVFDENFLYVSSIADQILQYDGTSGKFIDAFVSSGSGGLDLPTGLTFGPDGNLYVASGNTNEVIVYHTLDEKVPDSKKFVGDKLNKLLHPTHIEIKNGNVCVNVGFNKAVNCYDEKTGEIVGKQLTFSSDVIAHYNNSIVGPDGKSYVSNNLMNEILSLSGTDSELSLKIQDTFLRTPSHLTFKDNFFYVSNSNEILKFDSTGSFIDVFVATNDGSLRNPQGLAFTDNGLVVNSYNDRMLKYDLEGNFVGEFVSSNDHKIFKPIGLAIDEDGSVYTTQQGSILKFSGDVNPKLEKTIQLEKIIGEFLPNDQSDSTSISPPDPHGIFLDKEQDILYINVFNKNVVLRYNLNTDEVSKLNIDVELQGPEGLAFDEKNKILYISNTKNNSIVAYDLTNDSSYLIIKNSGNGLLSLPRGLFFNDENGNLYIINSNNNEILEYDPRVKSLNVFSNVNDNSITIGGIAFGPDQNLFVINTINNDIYRYDLLDQKFIGVFVDSDESFSKYAHIDPVLTTNDFVNVKFSDLLFTSDGKFLLVSDPPNDRIFVYNEKGALHDVFVDLDNLEYPKDLALNHAENRVLVNNYGINVLSSLTISDGHLELEESVFIDPEQNNLVEIVQIGYDLVGNVYVVGGKNHQILKYGSDGDYLGDFSFDEIYLGQFSSNPLKQYTLNGIDLNRNDILVVYDIFSEQSIAKMTLDDTLEFLTPITNLLYDTASFFNPIDDPDIKSKKVIKHTGFFIGNKTSAYGQVLTKNVDQQLLIKIETFSINYDKEDYVSIPNNFNSVGPQPTICLSDDFSECIKPNNNELKINVGDNFYMLDNVSLENFDPEHFVISIHDKNEILAYVPLKEYGVARISLDSFVDWMQYYLPIFPFITLIMIFPIVFDYIRSIFKLLFFPLSWLREKSKKKISMNILYSRITILIPAHNEEYGIKKAIESALATDYPDKEIIVIDDGSTDNTYLIASKFAEKGLIKLIHRDTASGSKATALNYGANYATGDYIVCMDGDTKLDKDSLKNAMGNFDDKVVALSGNVKITSGDDGITNTVTQLQKYEYMVAIELGRRFTSFFQVLLVISGAFGIFKKNIFRGVHTFDNDTLTEDFDLTLKFRKTKGVIRFVGNSIAYTYCPNNMSVWIKQRNRWAYGQFQTLLKNKNILTSKFPIRDKISFLDMFVLDIFLALMFPIGLVALGVIAVSLYFEDNLHVLVYPLFFTMMSFLILEILIFLYAVSHSGKDRLHSLKLVYLAPVMTFFYRPFLKMVNLRAYVRAYFKKHASW